MNNINNQTQNRGNFGNYSSQLTNQQQNLRNRPVSNNNNVRIVNAEDGVEDTNPEQMSNQDNTDNSFTDFQDHYDQNGFLEDDYSGN